VSLSIRIQFAEGQDGNEGDVEDAWIGMATTHAILGQYGGSMTATIEPASPGSARAIRYSVRLPLAMDSNRSRAPAAPATAGTVLLVEQEPLLRELSRDMLERQGFGVLTAGSASEAERFAHGGERFDMAIVAWPADGKDGSALAQSLRQMRPGLPVLFIAELPDGSPDRYLLAEGSAILQKPFSADSLGRRIRQLLDRG